MRLICGFLHLDGRPAEAAQLDAMAAAMIEPGLTPTIACHVEGPVALAMLDFTASGPGSRSDLPPALPRGASGLVLAADARLYEGPDGEIAGPAGEAALLGALERGGSDGGGADGGLRGFAGDFALAAWSPRQRTLLCARDGFGVRPLFTVDRPGLLFAFASLPRGLHAGGFAERALDETYLLRELLMAATPTEGSLFHGVGRLAPGSWMRLSAERRQGGQHWRLDRKTAGRRRCRPDEAAEEMAALVAQAVRCRLPASGPVASHLSGGLDSGSITILAARTLRGSGRPVLAYPFLPGAYGDYRPEGEEPLVRLVLEQEPDLVCVPTRIDAPLGILLPRMDSDQVMPFDPADPDAWICMNAAARGAQVLLSGWGGDQGASYNGRAALAEALLHGRWRWLAGEVRMLAEAHRLSSARMLRGQVLPYLLPVPLWNLVGRLCGRRPGIHDSTMSLLRREAVADLRLNYPMEGPDDVDNRHRLLGSSIVTRRAERWALTGARTGVAIAFPLLDRRVVEFALSLPSGLFLRGGVHRRLFRDAMTGILPEGVLQSRAKRRPFPELHLLLSTQREALLRWVADTRGHPRVSGLVDLDAVEQRLRALPAADEAQRRAAELETDEALLTTVISLMRIVRVAAYVRQHH